MEVFHTHLDRFDFFSRKTPVATWSLERSWEIAPFEPVLHRVCGCHSKQRGSLRAGERVCLCACHQALNQIAAARIA